MSSRSSYSRPCDACALRKIRCSSERPCKRCLERGITCTQNRPRKKTGPKDIQVKTRQTILGAAQHLNLLSIGDLLPCLQFFQTWFYGMWPVISTTHLISKILGEKEELEVTEENKLLYSLACIVSAVAVTQAGFLTSGARVLVVPRGLSSWDYHNEAVRVLASCQHKSNPSFDSVLVAFFFCVFLSNKLDDCASLIYLRESISIAQILGMHDPSFYSEKSAAESHYLRKLYYLLFITERYFCFELKLPPILESTIPIPSLRDEENPELISGFLELVKVFTVPDKPFLREIVLKHNTFPTWCTPQSLRTLQHLLAEIEVGSSSPEIHRANILVSQHWMSSLTWHLAYQRGMLVDHDANSLSPYYPAHIAHRFLSATKDVSLFAFESNGYGACMKLLEICNSLADSIPVCDFTHMTNSGFFSPRDALASIFNLALKLKKNKLVFPQDLCRKIEAFANTSSSPTAYITEIHEDEDSESPNVGFSPASISDLPSPLMSRSTSSFLRLMDEPLGESLEGPFQE